MRDEELFDVIFLFFFGERKGPSFRARALGTINNSFRNVIASSYCQHATVTSGARTIALHCAFKIVSSITELCPSIYVDLKMLTSMIASLVAREAMNYKG